MRTTRVILSARVKSRDPEAGARISRIAAVGDPRRQAMRGKRRHGRPYGSAHFVKGFGTARRGSIREIRRHWVGPVCSVLSLRTHDAMAILEQ
jgi:hypothetical protein